MASTTTTTTLPPAIANPGGSPACLFISTIERYTLKDIELIKNIAIESEKADEERDKNDILYGTGRCATALASVCFSCIEQIGLLVHRDLTTNGGPEEKLKKLNYKNAVEFFNFLHLRGGFNLIVEKEIEAMYALFRNKVTHNLFPRHGLGVAFNSNAPLDQLIVEVEGSYSLNINFLIHSVKTSIELLKGLVCDAPNPGLVLHIDNNVRLLHTAEESILKNRYGSDAALQPYFNSWMPTFPF